MCVIYKQLQSFWKKKLIKNAAPYKPFTKNFIEYKYLKTLTEFCKWSFLSRRNGAYRSQEFWIMSDSEFV